MSERAAKRSRVLVLADGERIARMLADGVEPRAIQERLGLTARQVRWALRVWRAAQGGL